MVAQGKNDISFLRSTIVYAIVLYFLLKGMCVVVSILITHRGAKRQVQNAVF